MSANRKLKAHLFLHNIKHDELAKALNIAKSTLSRKLNNETLTQKDMEKIIELLNEAGHGVDYDIFFNL